MKKYEEPIVKLHELKVKTSMLAGSPEQMRVDTKASGSNPNLEDFTEVAEKDVW